MKNSFIQKIEETIDFPSCQSGLCPLWAVAMEPTTGDMNHELPTKMVVYRILKGVSQNWRPSKNPYGLLNLYQTISKWSWGLQFWDASI